MNTRKVVALALAAATGLGFSTFANAGALTCDDTTGARTRTWTWDSADACGTLQGTPMTASFIETLGGAFDLTLPTAWSETGEVTGAHDTSLLNIAFGEGEFGEEPGTGTWSLESGFWDLYSQAVVTIHVGGGGQAMADHGVFLITAGQYSGSWSFTQTGTNGGGGGISNFKLWTAPKGKAFEPPPPPPVEVPEPGTMMLLGAALVGLALHGRRSKA